MRINKKLESMVIRLEKLKEEEKTKLITTFDNLLSTKYPIHEVITAKEFTKIIADIYNQRKDRIIKIEIDENTENSEKRNKEFKNEENGEDTNDGS
ncbi:hypothetical protein EII29_02500 [Leptotrichia sp. OH3620_COT-345]|uniref:hypothetical protein n=1 Tax=Leptotrichia sp. OH3620_COT-345 TaxID=2491048 RepID=UPI000F653937|nr:hypothetical protein [Leptotrichia sp. OH3620_COT-345]RRD40369.1 hypothetical protein EII29_02500 [Leptotrichia sp. OH3620_COT-345]